MSLGRTIRQARAGLLEEAAPGRIGVERARDTDAQPRVIGQYRAVPEAGAEFGQSGQRSIEDRLQRVRGGCHNGAKVFFSPAMQEINHRACGERFAAIRRGLRRRTPPGKRASPRPVNRPAKCLPADFFRTNFGHPSGSIKRVGSYQDIVNQSA